MKKIRSIIVGIGSVKAVKSGSALVITLILMSLLITVTLGVSALVIRELKIGQSIVGANRAFYAAEAGVERALLVLRDGGEGFEPSEVGRDYAEGDFAGGLKYEVKVVNRAGVIPFFDEKKPVYVDVAGELSGVRNEKAKGYNLQEFLQSFPELSYRRLPYGKTVVIPLHYLDSNGEVRGVSDFLIQYYVNFDVNSIRGLSLEESKQLSLSNINLLRWKIYGRSVDGKTESISDFFPGADGAGSSNPICVGTNQSLKFLGLGDVVCKLFNWEISIDGEKSTISLWDAARECYQSDAGYAVTGGLLIQDNPAQGCKIKAFIDSHERNYLVLTNMINPELLGLGAGSDVRDLEINFRIIAEGIGDDSRPLPLEAARINSVGFSGDGVMKVLETQFAKGRSLEVFNFALYSR